MKILRVLLFSWPFLVPCGAARAQAATPAEPVDNCGKLAVLSLPNATVTSAQTYAAGKFVGPKQAFTGADLSAFYSKLPAFCRVVVQAKPTSDSDIIVEIWMPLAAWNGRLQGWATAVLRA
jgi:feruloyl esterase